MAELVEGFLSISGLSVYPQTLEELIPYLFQFVVGCTLLSGVFAVIGRIVQLFFDTTRR
jgi:hypothetical protein